MTLGGRGLPSVDEVYGELNQWGRQCWAQLDAEAPVLAEAATLGGSLADTFWHMHSPIGDGTPTRKETWRYLLTSQRLIATIRRVRRVEPYLPAHVGPMLRHSLWEWSIAGQLIRSSSGELEIAHPFLYRLRSLGWARTRRHRQMKATSRGPLELTNEEEKDVWKRLRNQMIVWEHLVFNRPLSHLMRPSDWRQVRWVSLALYASALVVFTIGGGVLVAVLLRLVNQLLGYVLPFLAAPTEFKDQLTLASTVVAVLAFLATQFRRGLDQLRHLYDSIHGWVMMRKLQQRSLRTWDGQTKLLRWIWLQRLLRAEDA